MELWEELCALCDGSVQRAKYLNSVKRVDLLAAAAASPALTAQTLAATQNALFPSLAAPSVGSPLQTVPQGVTLGPGAGIYLIHTSIILYYYMRCYLLSCLITSDNCYQTD